MGSKVDAIFLGWHWDPILKIRAQRIPLFIVTKWKHKMFHRSLTRIQLKRYHLSVPKIDHASSSWWVA